MLSYNYHQFGTSYPRNFLRETYRIKRKRNLAALTGISININLGKVSIRIRLKAVSATINNSCSSINLVLGAN